MPRFSYPSQSDCPPLCVMHDMELSESKLPSVLATRSGRQDEQVCKMVFIGKDLDKDSLRSRLEAAKAWGTRLF